MSTKLKARVLGKPIYGKGSLTLLVSLNPKSLKMIYTPFGVVFDLEDASLVGELGAPGFPMQLLRVALPPLSDVTNINVTVIKKTNITNEPVFVAPMQEPVPGSPSKPIKKTVIKRSLKGKQPVEIKKPDYVKRFQGILLPHLQKYQEAAQKPILPIRVSNIEHRKIASILTLEANPVSQNSKGIIEFASRIKITLNYESISTIKKEGAYIGSRDFKPARTKIEAKRQYDILQREVLNPDWLIDISNLIPILYSKYDYLIITDNHKWDAESISTVGEAGELVVSFQKLINWKKKRGLKARIVTISNIVNNTFGDFKTGARDLQEVIRNFLKYAYDQWEIDWVLLGGDISIIPERIIESGCRGYIQKGTNDPPDNNKSVWTGTFLKMHVVDPGEWWPGDWPLLLVNPATGIIIPHDPAGASSAANPGWYYTTDDTYSVLSPAATQFVRVNGPATLLDASLQWLYRWNRIPTDLYYSSLVGTNYNIPGLHDWDLNDNGHYGQHTDSTDPDGVEYSADIGLGRAPVENSAEAEAFVDKVIAYEQFRKPDGTLLNINWPRRLTMVSSNWGKTIRIYSTADSPPGNNKYYHNTGGLFSFIRLKDPFSDMEWHLFATVTEVDVRDIPYNFNAAVSGRGWYFAKSETDLSVSEKIFTIFGTIIHLPIPTSWIVVYGYSDEVAPLYFIFDKAIADGSMTDQELLRKQIASDFPAIDTLKRLYEDKVDLPASDASTPSVDYLTQSRLRDTLNFGQHFVSLSGHGSQGGCCWLNTALAQNLTNGYHTFIAWADSCLTNDFEYSDSMSEHLLKNPNGGAVGYIGNTRFSWIGIGDDYQREFFNRLKTVRHLSLLNDSRFNLPNNLVYYKWVKFALNLIGDPEMPVWVGKPKNLHINHPVKIYKVAQYIITEVNTSSGLPIKDATVSFNMGSWLVSAHTGTSGKVNLYINPPSIGEMEIIVTAQDYIPYFGKIEVEELVECKSAILCKTNLSCKLTINCKTAILCKEDIHCLSSLSCKPSVVCTSAILCNSSILCGSKIFPCNEKIACNLLISGCRVGIGQGCPSIDPIPWEDPIDILRIFGVKDIKELAKNVNSPNVKKIMGKINPVSRKAITLMLKQINKE